MKTVLSLDSFGEVGAKAKALGDAANVAAANALLKGAQAIVPAAQAKAPRSLVHRTGRKRSPLHLADRIVAAKMDGTGVAGVTVDGGPNGTSFYWKYLEYGTVKLAARPFFRPAALEKADEVSRIVQESLKDELGL